MSIVEEELAKIKRMRQAWFNAMKPERILDFHDKERFDQLWKSKDPLEGGSETISSVWWNEPPRTFEELGPLAMFHPMVAKCCADNMPVLANRIFQHFDIAHLYEWQPSWTRWVYLTRRSPDILETFEDTCYIVCWSMKDGKLFSNLDSAS